LTVFSNYPFGNKRGTLTRIQIPHWATSEERDCCSRRGRCIVSPAAMLTIWLSRP